MHIELYADEPRALSGCQSRFRTHIDFPQALTPNNGDSSVAIG